MRYCSRCHAAYEADERFCPIDGGVVTAEDRAPADSLIGRTLAGRYLLLSTIGRGGMGVVYEAEHVGLGKRVAVKLLLDTYSDDREVLARFHQEARTASRIGHENIIDILDIGDHDGRSFIAMELLAGTDLRRVCRDEGALALGRAVPILRQICRALSAAHAKDVIHRDMKPENVFLAQKAGHAGFVKLMDFGISKIKAARESQVRLTQTGAVIGTPLYMAPEQALGRLDIDHRVDIYALGVMMFEILTGEPPFTATTYMGLMTQHLQEKPPSPRKLRPDLPVAFERLILKALEKEPGARFQSMEELEAALPEVDETPAPLSAPRKRLPTSKPHVAVSTAVRTGVFAGPGRWRNILLIAGGVAIAAGGIVAAKKIHDAQQAPVATATTPPVTAPSSAPASAPATSAPVSSAGSIVETPVVSMDLDSTPPNARVLLDGVDKGNTPLKILHVPAGLHTLELALDGYVTVKVQKDVHTAIVENFILTAVPKVATPSSAAAKSQPTQAKLPKSPPQAPVSKPQVPVTSAAVSQPRTEPQTPPPQKVDSAATPPDDDHKPSPYEEHKKSPY